MCAMRARARKNKKSIVNYCKKCWYTEQFCASISFFMVCHILKNDRNSQTIAIEGMVHFTCNKENLKTE